MSTEQNLTNRAQTSPEKIHQRPAVAPAVDIYENPEELLVVADVPGVEQKSLSIRLEKGELTFEGRRSDAAEVSLSAENLPDYRRSFLVPQGVDAERIAADVSAGILKIHLPKSAALKPRQIPIAGG
jgi:HSP20 family protein